MIAPVGRIVCPWCGSTAGIVWPGEDRTLYVTRGRDASETTNTMLGNRGPFGGLPSLPWCNAAEHRWTVPPHRLRRAARHAGGALVNIQARRVR